MGIYSTVTILRETAIARISELLDDATNEELAEALFCLTQNHTLYNYIIVDERIEHET